MAKKSNPIGIFDSGIGGLTVAHEIVKLLPNESLIYLGDTARVPYGTRGKEVIEKFALELAQFLINRDVKCLVVACNTISATCLSAVIENSPVLVIGVIDPAAGVASKTTKNHKIGVIGTRAAIGSGAYESKLLQLNPDFKVYSQACPLFVPIAEEGLGDSKIAKLAVEEYLSGLKNIEVDTLVLGCTHYPLLGKTIQEFMGKNVTLIDSAVPTAQKLKEILIEEDLLSDEVGTKREFFVTDAPERVFEIADVFFGEELIPKIQKVTLI